MMYKTEMLNVINAWGAGDNWSEGALTAYTAWVAYVLPLHPNATAEEVADAVQEGIDDMRRDDNFEDTHRFEGPINVARHYEMYDVASAIVKYFRKRFIDKADANVTSS